MSRARARARAVRRRRAAVLGAAAFAFATGVTMGAGHDDPPTHRATPQTSAPREFTRGSAPSDRPRNSPEHRPLGAATGTPAPVDRLSLERQVGELVVLRFEGTQVPDYVRRVLHDGWAAGAILFRGNVVSAPQLQALTGVLRRSARAAGATPIICTDQEGGAIRNVPWAPPAPPQPAQRPGPDATAAARALRALGVNVALAPVADVPRVPGSVMAGRAYSGDVAAATAAAVKGWRAGGVAPTAKHFPGLGATTVNTDKGSTVIRGGAPTPQDLAPFKAAIAAGVPIVMSSHAVYPARDGANIASQSPALVTGLLRGELHFTGVVMTDSIEAAAVRATGSTENAAVRSIEAGNDIVLTTGQGSWVRTYRALLAQARASRSFRARVRESAARVLALQATLT